MRVIYSQKKLLIECNRLNKSIRELKYKLKLIYNNSRCNYKASRESYLSLNRAQIREVKRELFKQSEQLKFYKRIFSYKMLILFFIFL